MDICVRCGACADKCHYFLGSGDPKNMPVLRAELLRSVYRKDFTAAGKLLGKLAGARELTPQVLKEWFYYFYQCTECRRCSVFCPYGIDTAEITMMVRELLHLVGIGIDWVTHAGGELLQDGQSPRNPTARVQGQCRVCGGRPRGDHGYSGRGARQQEGRGNPVRRTVGRLLWRPALLRFPRLPGAVSRDRSRLHLEHLRVGGRELRSVPFGRDDEASERQDLRRSQTVGREVDHRRRVRPHVAGAAPIHGHHEWPGRLPRRTGFSDDRDEVRERQIDEDGAHLRVHGGSDPQRQDQARSEPQRSLEGHLPRLLQHLARRWGSWRSRATS